MRYHWPAYLHFPRVFDHDSHRAGKRRTVPIALVSEAIALSRLLGQITASNREEKLHLSRGEGGEIEAVGRSGIAKEGLIITCSDDLFHARRLRLGEHFKYHPAYLAAYEYMMSRFCVFGRRNQLICLFSQ